MSYIGMETCELFRLLAENILAFLSESSSACRSDIMGGSAITLLLCHRCVSSSCLHVRRELIPPLPWRRNIAALWHQPRPPSRCLCKRAAWRIPCRPHPFCPVFPNNRALLNDNDDACRYCLAAHHVPRQQKRLSALCSSCSTCQQHTHIKAPQLQRPWAEVCWGKPAAFITDVITVFAGGHVCGHREPRSSHHW